MSKIEAAASLFGSSDSGSDFFTAEDGGNSAAHSPAPMGAGAIHSGDGDLQAQHPSDLFDKSVLENAGDSASLFSSQETEVSSSLFDGVVGQSPEEQTHFATDHQTNALGYDQGAYQNGSYEASNAIYDQYANGWYDEHGQWQTSNQGGSYDQYGQASGYEVSYDPQQHYQPSSSLYNAYGTQPDSNTYSYGSGNASYASPQSNHHALSPSQSYQYQPVSPYAPQASPHQPQYDRYAPPAPSVSVQTVASSTTTSSAYDPYKPATNAASQQQPKSPYAISQSFQDPYGQTASYAPAAPSALAPSSSFKPPPPPAAAQTSKPTAPPYRPPTSNAYDPPIPTTKPKPKRSMTALKSPASAMSPVSPLPSSNTLPPPPRSESVPVSGLPPPPRSPLQYEARSPPINLSASTDILRSKSPYDPPIDSGRTSKPPARAPLQPRSSVSTISPPPLSSASSYGGIARSASPYDPPLPSRSPEPSRLPRQAKAPSKPAAQNAPQEIAQSHRTHSVSAEVIPEEIPEAHSEVDDVEGWSPEGGAGLSGVSPSSRAGTPHMPSSPPKPRGHIQSGERRTVSPDIAPPPSSSSQRASSPQSDSGRSYSGSVGRSSPLHSFHNRSGTVTVGQSFSALEETKPYGSEGYSFGDQVGATPSHSIGSFGGYGLPSQMHKQIPPSYDKNVINLASDTPLAGKPSSPPIPKAASPYDPYSSQVAQAPSNDCSEPSHTSSPDPYAPPVNNSGDASRARSMSNMSSFSTASKASSYDPYAPSTHSQQHKKRGSSPMNTFNLPQPGLSFTTYSNGMAASPADSYSPPPVTGPYAPSPSLLGTNDPLGRAKAKVPVISFGFGGKIITCFHTSPTYETGFDVALSSRKCTDVHIRTLHKVIPESALDISSAQYPGPLLGDPGSPVSTLMKTATAASARKTKKAKVLKYLEDRAVETEKGLGYLNDGSAEKRSAEGKLALIRVLIVLVEYDGQLHSNQANEAAVRAALLPRLADSTDSTGANAYLNAPTGAALASGSFSSAASGETPLVEYAVHSSALSTLQDFLLRGEKRKAFHYALDEKMWAHAMVISSSIDKEAFKDVVTEFIRTELGVKAGETANGLESLRLAYGLYSGQSSTAVQHLFPTRSLQAGPMLTLQPPTPMAHMTPLSPNFPSAAQASNMPVEVLSQWPDYATMLFSGQMGPDSSSSLTTLGDYLLANDWVEAAHCCYLLSPLTSPINGVGGPSVRIVLVGCQSPHKNTSFANDPDAFIFSEILEYALSLHTPIKGQEPFGGFPHLQVYRLIRAMQYADLGHVTLAKRYLDAISGCTTRPSPFLTQQFSNLIRDFYGRISGESELEKSGSWITSKISKPSLNGIGGWIGGSLSKFVAGDEPSSPEMKDTSLSNNAAYAGTFQNFSNISSANTSRAPSPAPSQSASYGRPSLAIDRSASGTSYPSYGRSPSSSFDHDRNSMRGTPPLPRMSMESYASSTNITKSIGNDAHYGINGHASGESESKQQSGGWWSSAYGDGAEPTPTAASFLSVDAASSTGESSGFISLMDTVASYTPSPSATTFSSSQRDLHADDFDDDLGLSNSANKKREEEQPTEGGKKVELKTEALAKPDIKPTTSASGSWIGRLFSRTPSASSTPGPVKANLGEETSFYYDKDLKKWVNKKVGAEPEKAAHTPPPPRAQTASPSRSMGPMGMGNGPHGPPPPSPMAPPNRPFSAMESGPPSGPPKGNTFPRIRSNLAPDEGKDPSLPPTPSTPAAMAGLTAAPPTGRPKSAAKKSVRSRYVDVFQQQQ